MTKTTLPFHNTTTEESIMRTFLAKTVKQQNLFENFLFDETILISNDLGIKQTVREAIEIKRNLNNNTSNSSW